MGFHPVDAGSNPVHAALQADFMAWYVGDGWALIRRDGVMRNRFSLVVVQQLFRPVSVVDARDASNVVDRVRFLDWVFLKFRSMFSVCF